MHVTSAQDIPELPNDPDLTKFTSDMNHIFQLVDKNTVSSGLLKDYGLEFMNMSAFDGIPADSNYVDMSTWKMLYASV